jgi:pimeloyl-ACP methyl ester carboxylesterase
MAEIILVPGMWLDGSSWDAVAPLLQRAGHRPRAITLPGMESKDADRSKITLSDHVGAIIDAIDAADGKVVLVGHSAGAGIAYAALDARPDRVVRAVYVGGFPTGDGDSNAGDYPAAGGEVPFPDWSDFDEADLGGLDDRARAEFRARAIAWPARVASDPQRLSDERRYDVPVTVICTEFSSAMLREWIEAKEPPVMEFARIRQVEYVDLPTGHWPQFTRPEDLAAEILRAAGAA